MMKNVTEFANVTDRIDDRSSAAVVLTAIILSVIFTLALFGNMIVIVAIRQTRVLREDLSNTFLVNLSITDLSSAAIVMLSALVSLVRDEWSFGDAWCNVVCACNYCLIIVSMLTLCFISLDRWYAIASPLHYLRYVTRRRIIMLIAYSWMQGIAFAIVPVVMRWIDYDYWEVICAIQWHKEHAKAVYYVVIAFILCFLVPGVVLIVSYSKIAHRTRKSKNRSSSITSGVIRQEQYSESTARIIRSLFVIIIAYFVCMTPFSLTKFIKVVKPDPHFVPNYINLTSAWIGYTSSAINPLIYGIFRQDFRLAFKRSLKRIFCPNQPLESSINLSTFNQTYTVKH